MLQMIRGVHNYYLCRNHSVLMVSLKIQNDHFSLHIFTLFLCYLLKVLNVYFQYISQTFHLLLKNLNLVIQDKCYRPHNQVKFFSRACLSKTMIIYDRLYQGHILLRCNSCFRKRNASCYICKFLTLKQEKQQKYAKFDLFQYFVSCSKYLHWIIESQKSQLIILIYRIKLCTIMSIL